MRSRLFLRRILQLRAPRPSQKDARFFTGHPRLGSQTRPQLPFLSVPLARNQQFRQLTTDRRAWLTFEVLRGVKFVVGVALMGCFLLLGYASIHQEWLERGYPTPHEWTFWSRVWLRLAKWLPEQHHRMRVIWAEIGDDAKFVLGRLEDPNQDGAGLSPSPNGQPGYDISLKSEPWRRGYYETVLLCARAAEFLDDHVVDKKGHVFPADQVWGPSNPDPKPIPFGSPSAPHEDDCKRAFDTPDSYYLRILAGKGFTTKQMMDAALRYAHWLDFNGRQDESKQMYEWALLEAASGQGRGRPADPAEFARHALDDAEAHPPSANLLTALTALATYNARHRDVSSALPVFVSALRARRALPSPPPKAAAPVIDVGFLEGRPSPWTYENMMGLVKRLVFPPPYPPPPDDGLSPPRRDPKELCEEAALSLYIGEIIYASQDGSGGGKGGKKGSSREDGLSWTRAAVDLAEEQLHELQRDGPAADRAGLHTCRECLSAGLENWASMVALLAREEKEREQQKNQQQQQQAAKSSWVGLWAWGAPEHRGRWAAEASVVEERAKRARGLMKDVPARRDGPPSFWSLVSV